MKTLCALLIFASSYCLGQEFKFIDQFILQENRESMMFAVSAGTSRSLWINCPVDVYDELYQDRSGYLAIMHLSRKRVSGGLDINYGAVEKLLMLAILGEPSEDQRSFREEMNTFTWGISRIRSEAVFAGFPENLEGWKIWVSKLDARNRSLMRQW